MTGTELMAVAGFFITVFLALFGVWKYLDSKLTAGRKETQKVADDLAEHKLHTAEKYITKEGLSDTTEQIMGAISGVKTAIDNMTLRVDRVVENQNKPQRSTRSG